MFHEVGRSQVGQRVEENHDIFAATKRHTKYCNGSISAHLVIGESLKLFMYLLRRPDVGKSGVQWIVAIELASIFELLHSLGKVIGGVRWDSFCRVLGCEPTLEC